MAFIPAPSCAELVPRFRGPGGNIMNNVYNFARIGGGEYDEVLLQDLINTYIAWEGATTMMGRSNELSLVSVYARALDYPNAPVVEYQLPTPKIGAHSSPLLPGNVTLSISMRTGRAGRSYRGRSYWVGLYESTVAGDFVTTATANTILGKMGNLLSGDFVLDGHQLVVLSKQENGVPRSIAVATPVTNMVIVDTRVDTQRRRLIGTGT